MIKTAVIGAGVMGSNHCRTIFNSESFQLTHVLDVNEDRANALATSYGGKSATHIDEILNCEAIVIATVTEAHFDLAKLFLEQKKPVLVEKPLTLDIKQTLELSALARRSNVPLLCGFVERFNPAMSTAINLLDEPVVHMTAMRHSPSPGRATTGVIEDLLIHDLDLALLLMADQELIVKKATVRPNESQLVEIAEVSIVGLDKQIAHLSSSRWGQRKVRQWSISTNSKLIEVDLLQQTVVVFENIDQAVGSGGGSSYRTRTVIEYPFIARGGEPLGLQLAHFAQLINGKASLENEIASIERTHSVLDNILLNG